MKTRSYTVEGSLALLCAAALCVVGGAGSASAATSTLLSGDASLTIDVTAAGVGGISSVVNAGVEQLGLTTYFYRVGGTGSETSVFSLPFTEAPQADPDETLLVFENDDIAFELRLFLGDSSTQTVIDEVFRVTNKTTSPLSLFRYSDFDLGSTADSAIAAEQPFPGAPLSGMPISLAHVDQEDSANTSLTTAALTGLAGLTTPVRVAAGDAATLLASLTDGSTTTLSSSLETSGPGDLASLLQWEVDPLLSGASFSGSAKTTLDLAVIPEPTALIVYAGLAVAAAMSRRT